MATTRRARKKRPRSKKKKAGPGELTWKDIQKEVHSWSAKDLAAFVLDRVAEDAELRARVERQIALRRSPKEASARLRREIDRVLDVEGYIGWDEAFSYAMQLDDVIRDIRSYGKDAPGPALELILHFLTELPSVFGSVHDECHLAEVCDDLTEAALPLWRKAGTPFRLLATPILDGWVEDDECRFDHSVERLTRTRLRRDDREWLIQELESRREGLGTYRRQDVDKLVASLRRGARQTGPRGSARR